ncbi:MAG TPA: hypothetical protein VFL17_22245 [Anaerolineae bacterium]|nr:hypothetical protein [Anaerolineae bacterium]
MAWNGSREVAFILADVPDFPRPPAEWERRVRERTFYDPVTGADLRAFIRAVSYGRARLTGDIYGPFNVALARNPDGSVHLGVTMDNAIRAAQGLIEGYLYACIVFTQSPGPAWAFWGYSPGYFYSPQHQQYPSTYTSTITGTCYVDTDDPLGVWAMENLHAITQFGDLYGISDSPGAFDVMDCSCGTHPSSFTKSKLGWLDGSEVVVIPPGTPARTVTLQALGSPRRPGSVYAAKLTSTTGSQRYFLVEARMRVDRYENATPGVSTGISSEGVVVYWIDESSWPPVHLRRPVLTPGAEFADQVEGVRISEVAQAPSGFAVRIERGEPAECDWIRTQLDDLGTRIDDLRQDLVEEADPRVRAGILQEIRALESQAQRLRNRANTLGCSL